MVKSAPLRPLEGSCYVKMSLVLGTLVMSGVLAGMSEPRQREPMVQTEPKPKYIPAGPRTKPFDVTRHVIPPGEIQSGGPPKDGIPALDHPAFVSAVEADRVLKPSEVVIGLEFNGIAKAYPIRILNWHEVVNDDVGRQPLLVSW